MSWVWVLLTGISFLWAVFAGTTGELSAAILQGAGKGIQLAITLAGPLCLWSGLSHVLEQIGWIDRLTRFLSPILRKLFPDTWQDKETRNAVCGNLSANLLGLGNAATPLGIRAVRRMAVHTDGRASDEMCRLIVLNTASIQLIPTTVAAVRAGLGAEAPFSILPAVWITSVCSVAAGLLAARVLAKWVP